MGFDWTSSGAVLTGEPAWKDPSDLAHMSMVSHMAEQRALQNEDSSLVFDADLCAEYNDDADRAVKVAEWFVERARIMERLAVSGAWTVRDREADDPVTVRCHMDGSWYNGPVKQVLFNEDPYTPVAFIVDRMSGPTVVPPTVS